METAALPLGLPRPERGDAARNRRHLLDVARQMVAESGVEHLTMDGLAERAGLGKGTVFRRFRTRAGIFHALLDEDEKAFQQSVLSGPPPLGPGADPVTRLIAFGRARIDFLFAHAAIARASLDANQSVPVGTATISQFHVRMLLGRADIGVPDLDTLAVQLTAALEAPILLYLHTPAGADTNRIRHLADGWQTLIERTCAALR
ncbi:TetR/AcrR family transcriptional regulator [Nocardia sp. XZ_19_385]|uniref:TetR/AcrR family transcriptional regulator n=1 Tax=Nocardia sp. XZ_19_385 TaxID=2769488 RepID=UPI00188E87A9|nr:TetR/AcrR family transcriptional regulator [Nocardia sp. XZ_19_385]